MDDSYAKKFQKELNGGLVGLVLLAVLNTSTEDLYGYEIAKRLQRTPDGPLIFKEGTIYPVLRALSASGLLTSRVVPSYSGPPRRYYRITDDGRAVLNEWRAIWRATRTFVDRCIEQGDPS
ncbi:MAG: PadR family transcriptional regulator [Steroidobacteraceae bacterium]